MAPTLVCPSFLSHSEPPSWFQMKSSIQEQTLRGVPFCSFRCTSFASFFFFLFPEEAFWKQHRLLPPPSPTRELSQDISLLAGPSPCCPVLITQPISGSNGHNPDALLMKGCIQCHYLDISHYLAALPL